MSFLFGKGSTKDRLKWAFEMSIKHGLLLTLFVSVYKSVQCLLANIRKKACPLNSFIAGVIGAYCLLKFKTDMSIN